MVQKKYTMRLLIFFLFCFSSNSHAQSKVFIKIENALNQYDLPTVDRLLQKKYRTLTYAESKPDTFLAEWYYLNGRAAQIKGDYQLAEQIFARVAEQNSEYLKTDILDYQILNAIYFKKLQRADALLNLKKNKFAD